MALTNTETTDYALLMELIKNRTSVRKLKNDPVPEEYIEKILEAGRWAMSGANSQPWEFIVVTDPKVKKELFQAYVDINADFIYWMEQQRVMELRHPSYQMTHEEAVQKQRQSVGWAEAPFLIVVVGDGRRQWGTVQGAHTYGLDQTHLTDGLSNASMLMHLAGAALGLGSQHVTIHIEHPFKQILGVPEPLRLVLIMPFGYPAVPSMPGSRRPLEDMTHRNHYDMAKYMTNEQIIKYLYDLRGKTIPIYRNSYAGDARPTEKK
ncbi:MAG TPA: nitroreductase family protein [Candidatus Binatia bacterium]|nr:nitroreductase family protein [Candidatus Binatia bacterium]